MTTRALEDIPIREKFHCTKSNSDRKYRAIREDADTVFVYAYRKSRYGYRMGNAQFAARYIPCGESKTDENTAWHRRIRRAIRCLENSGLWPEKLDYLKNLDKMTWDDKLAIDRLYWNMPSGPHGGLPNRFGSPEWQEWFRKYPFMKDADIYGNAQPKTEYFWDGSEIKLESMYFGKGMNDTYKERIRNAIDGKYDFSIPRVRTNYDISFLIILPSITVQLGLWRKIRTKQGNIRGGVLRPAI